MFLLQISVSGFDTMLKTNIDFFSDFLNFLEHIY